MIMWKKRKVMSLIISLFALVACDTESEDYSDLETQAALINLQIDWPQKDKMAFFIHKAIPDELNNSIILSVLYKNKKAENLNSKNEIALYKVMLKNNYCNNQEIHKTFFERGIKFVYVIEDINGIEFDKYELSKEICRNISNISPKVNRDVKENKSKSTIKEYKDKEPTSFRLRIKNNCYSKDMTEIITLLNKYHQIKQEDFCNCLTDKIVEISDKNFIQRFESNDITLSPEIVQQTIQKVTLKANRFCLAKLNPEIKKMYDE